MTTKYIEGKYRFADVWNDGDSFYVNNWGSWHYPHTFDSSILDAFTSDMLFDALIKSNFLNGTAAKHPQGFHDPEWNENTLFITYYPPKLAEFYNLSEEAQAKIEALPATAEMIEIEFTKESAQ